MIPASDTDRLEELERRSAYQELAVEELSKRIWEQQLQIDHLEKMLRTLTERLKTWERGATDPQDPSPDKAPHYIAR